MSEEFGANPLSAVPADAPETSVREYAASLVRAGMSVDDANRHLATRNAAPLVRDSLELAEFHKERLMGDPSFAERYLRSDPAAVAEMTALDLRIAKGGLKLTDRDLSPSEYNFPSVDYRLDKTPAADVQQFRSEFASLSAELKLQPEHAKALVDAHLDAVERTNRMGDVDREAWGREQTAILENALGADAAEQITAAETTLRKVSRREMDLRKIVASNGANVAMQLVHQAQYLQAMKR